MLDVREENVQPDPEHRRVDRSEAESGKGNDLIVHWRSDHLRKSGKICSKTGFRVQCDQMTTFATFATTKFSPKA